MDQSLRDKIANIKELMARAATVGEAEAAAAAMQRLVLRHNLQPEDIDSSTKSEKEEYASNFIRVGEPRSPGLQWKINLIRVLASADFCTFIRYGDHGGDGVLVGQPSNQEIVRQMFETTVPTVERLAETEWTFMRFDNARMYEAGYPKAAAWKNAFKIGFSAGLSQKLWLERQKELDQIEGSGALIVVKDHELQEAVKEKVGETKSGARQKPVNLNGYVRGVEKGREHEHRTRIG